MTEEQETFVEHAEAAVLDELEVVLSTGRRVLVKRWGVHTGRIMIRRIRTVFRLWRLASEGDLQTLLDSAYDDLVAIAGDSVGIPVEELDSDWYALEDLVRLLDAVARVNFTERPSLGKALMDLGGTLEKMMPEIPPQPSTATTSPSSSS